MLSLAQKDGIWRELALFWTNSGQSPPSIMTSSLFSTSRSTLTSMAISLLIFDMLGVSPLEEFGVEWAFSTAPKEPERSVLPAFMWRMTL